MLGLAGAVTALWMTFAPCFLWIFAGAPYIEAITSRPRLAGALQAITAAVVGVILNLTIWFALHVFFATVTPWNAGPVQTILPDLSSLDWRTVLIACVAGWALLRRHMGLPVVLAGSAALGLVLSQLGG